MERRLARINSSTAGGTAGSGAKTHKVTLPSRWLQAMGITDEKREVELAFDGHQIVITRVVTIEEFYDEKKAQSHSVKTLKFWNADTLCTTIVAHLLILLLKQGAGAAGIAHDLTVFKNLAGVVVIDLAFSILPE